MNEQSLSTNLVTAVEDVYPLGYEPMVEDSTSSQERELLAHSSKEKEGEEEEKEGEDEAISPSGQDYRSFILPRICFMNDFVQKC